MFLKTILMLLALTSFAYATDRTMVTIQFRKGIFECPNGDEIVDWNVGGGNTYEHTCEGGKWLNSFKDFNGVIKLTTEEYEKADSKKLDELKNAEVTAWLEGVRNPPEYVEPSKEDYLKLYEERQAEAVSYLDKYSEKATATELQAVADKIEDSKVKVEEKVSDLEAKVIAEELEAIK